MVNLFEGYLLDLSKPTKAKMLEVPRTSTIEKGPGKTNF
jgi:hypothetical protein